MSSTNSSPFAGLETQHFQHKYYKENFNLVVNCILLNCQ